MSLRRRRARKTPVYCDRCVYFVRLGPKNEQCMCSAKAHFVSGPLSERSDIEGLAAPVKRNADNQCRWYRWFPSMRARLLRGWAGGAGGQSG